MIYIKKDNMDEKNDDVLELNDINTKKKFNFGKFFVSKQVLKDLHIAKRYGDGSMVDPTNRIICVIDDAEAPIFISFAEYRTGGTIGPKKVSLMFAFSTYGAAFYNLLDHEKYKNYILPEYIDEIDYRLVLSISDGHKTFWKKDIVLDVDSNQELQFYQGTLCTTILRYPVKNLWLHYELHHD